MFASGTLKFKEDSCRRFPSLAGQAMDVVEICKLESPVRKDDFVDAKRGNSFV